MNTMQLVVTVAGMTTVYPVESAAHAADLSRLLDKSAVMAKFPFWSKFLFNGDEIPVWRVTYDICHDGCQYSHEVYVEAHTEDEARDFAKELIAEEYSYDDSDEYSFSSEQSAASWASDTICTGGLLAGRTIEISICYQVILGRP